MRAAPISTARICRRPVHTQNRYRTICRPASIDTEDDAVGREFAAVHGKIDDAGPQLKFAGVRFSKSADHKIDELI